MVSVLLHTHTTFPKTPFQTLIILKPHRKTTINFSTKHANFPKTFVLFLCNFFFLPFLYLPSLPLSSLTLSLSPTSRLILSSLRHSRSLFVFVVVCCVIGAAPHTNTRTHARCHSLPQPNCQKRFRFRETRWFFPVYTRVISVCFVDLRSLFRFHATTTTMVVVLFSGIFFRSSRSIFSSGFFFLLIYFFWV